jgi:parvulin-like peptidyl-prolyl isomerase
MRQVAPRKASCFAGSLAALLLCGPALAAAGDSKEVVAQLGATRLMSSDLRDYVRNLDPQTRRQALADPQLASRLVQLEIIRKAILDQAVAKKWGQMPEVAKQVSTARDAIVLKSYLASAINMPADYPSDREIRSAYELNRDKFMVPRQYRLAQIFIASAAGDKNAGAALRKAQDLANRARAKGARFDELARQNSQHKPSAVKGGDTGWLIETQIVLELRAKIAGMTRGDVSDPIRTDQGWHIVRLLDTKPAAPKPLEEVRPLIAASLRQKKQQDEEQQYIVRLLQKTPVTVNEPQLRTVLEAAR